MKTTIAKILKSDRAMNNLLEQRLPLGISIQLGKVVQDLEPVFKKADEVRLEILKKYGVEILKDGQPSGEYQFTPESRKSFEADVMAAFNDEIELKIVEIDPERLPEACLTGKEAIALDWLWKKET